MKKIPNLIERKWKLKNGTFGIAYYYQHPRGENGKRPKPTPLGTNYQDALQRWASIHGVEAENLKPSKRLEYLIQSYFKWADNRELSKLSPQTLYDRRQYWSRLVKVFGQMNPELIEPSHLFKYFETRSSQSSAKKEIKFLSVVFNWAKARDLMKTPNPCTGIMKQMKVNDRRVIYVTDQSFQYYYSAGNQTVKDVMLFLYMTACRPTEAVIAKKTDIKHGELYCHLPKTEHSGNRMKRLPVEGELKTFIERQKNRVISSPHILSDENGQKLNLKGTLRNHFYQARTRAKLQAEKDGTEIQHFSLMDIRAKAATDKTVLDGIEEARKLLGHTTQKQTADYVRPLIGEASKALNPDKVEKVKGLVEKVK